MASAGTLRSSSAATRYGLPLAAAAAVLADVALDPAHRNVPLCPFHELTGWYCPLCGGLRAIDALVHGELATALRDNMLVTACVPLLVAAWLSLVVEGRAGRRPRLSRARIAVVIAVAVAFTVVRNLPAIRLLRPA